MDEEVDEQGMPSFFASNGRVTISALKRPRHTAAGAWPDCV